MLLYSADVKPVGWRFELEEQTCKVTLSLLTILNELGFDEPRIRST